MVEAEADQGIGEQAFRFNAGVAGLADTKGSFVHAAEGAVHSFQ
jgi:hypothetical protein